MNPAATAPFVLVLGLGESGQAMARWCALAGMRLRLADSRPALPRPLPPRLAAAELILGPFDERLLDGVDWVAVSPGLDPRVGVIAAARARGLEVLGECALFARARAGLSAPGQVVALTGTNGKTTCTTLTTALACAAGLDAVAAGNISPAMLDVFCDRLEAGRAQPQLWVLELSSFQLESAAGFAAEAGTVLNVTEDHLDRYADLDAYAATKAKLYAASRVAVVNRDDARVCAMPAPGQPVIRFGLDAPSAPADFGIAPHAGEDWLWQGDTPLVACAALRLVGRHNLANAQAALALLAALGLPPARLVPALVAFEGLAHRVQAVAQRADGVVFIDDSKGTNVGATLAALEGLGRPAVLIAGGDGKGQDFTPLGAAVARHARAVVLIGRDAPAIALALAGTGVPVRRAADMDEAVALAWALARPGDAVLLSPACASLDMFRNYAARADAFVAAVNRQLSDGERG